MGAMPSRHRWLVRAPRFALLTLVAELTGRSITGRLDGSYHVVPLAAPRTSLYPFLLAGIRAVAALALAALAWRIVRAHSTAHAAERLLHAVGGRRLQGPRLRVRLSVRLWLLSFGATALWFLVQNDATALAQSGRWPLLAPWLHTYALPVFAVLSVVVAVSWGLVRDWVTEVERYAASTFARAFRATAAVDAPPRQRDRRGEQGPRSLFGLDFESRPPPLPA